MWGKKKKKNKLIFSRSLVGKIKIMQILGSELGAGDKGMFRVSWLPANSLIENEMSRKNPRERHRPLTALGFLCSGRELNKEKPFFYLFYFIILKACRIRAEVFMCLPGELWGAASPYLGQGEPPEVCSDLKSP